jgi:predicted TIM-barrel fold metal-dependent hydrolase
MFSDFPQPPHDEGKQRRLTHRRKFLQQGVAAMGASALLSAHSAKANPRHRDNPAGFIDAHVHVWTSGYHYALVPPGARGDITPSTALPEDLLSVARPAGVDRIVLIQPGGYGFDNSYMLATIAHSPTVFRGVAKVDWHQSHPDVEMRKLKKHGVRGFRIYPDREPGPPTFAGEGFQKMFQCAAQEQMTLSLLINPDVLPAIPKQCERFPDTPIAIDHLARISAEGPILEGDVQALLALAKYPHVKIKVSAFYALGARRPPHDDLAPFIHRVYDAFGPQRMMWGSDCPYQTLHETYDESIALVRDRLHFLSSEDRVWILRKTAEASFFKD